ncbi:hypothetical protein COOONC_22216 [Cooperia oncophora]
MLGMQRVCKTVYGEMTTLWSVHHRKATTKKYR